MPGCEGIEVPLPVKSGVVAATAMEDGDSLSLYLEWASKGCSCDGCCYDEITIYATLPTELWVPGIQPATGEAEAFSGCNPSSGGSSNFSLDTIEIVEVTDTCIAGRIFGEDSPYVGFVAERE